MRASRSRPRSAAAIAAVATVLAALAVPARPVAAGEYDMVTVAVYEVDPAAGEVAVTVDIEFTNTFAAPAGQVSVFEVIRVGIHDHAAGVTASDTTGALPVTTAVEAGVNVATIQLRSRVEEGQTATLTLGYHLRDGEDPGIRIGLHLVSFPAWGFGTASQVTVDLPAEFEVRVDGDPMQARVVGDRTLLDSGTIGDPTHWLAQVGAIREPAYVTRRRAVPLAGGTVDLHVRAWADDREWGTATMDLLVAVLPGLESTFGLPYPGQGPLVVSEAVSGGGLDEQPTNGEIMVGFAEPPFTILHQVAHVWAGDELATDRWILEGLASWAAQRVAADVDVELPHDPTTVAANLATSAFPLADWSAEARDAEARAWAYAASWSLTNQAAEMAGDDAIRLALTRIVAGLDGYDPLSEVADPDSGEPGVAVDSRRYLDHLGAVTAAPVVEALAGAVLGDATQAELAARAEARTEYDALLVAAGDWGAPDPVRAAMVEWLFADARAAIPTAAEWLVGRDVLLREITDAGLVAPDRLGAAYRLHGGGAEAWAEIEAERAIVQAHAAVAATIGTGLGPMARIGLWGGPSPEERLAAATTAFAGGDLRAAADLLADLDRDLTTATAVGLVRLLSAVVVLASAILIGVIAIRRRRAASTTLPAHDGG